MVINLFEIFIFPCEIYLLCNILLYPCTKSKQMFSIPNDVECRFANTHLKEYMYCISLSINTHRTSIDRSTLCFPFPWVIFDFPLSSIDYLFQFAKHFHFTVLSAHFSFLPAISSRPSHLTEMTREHIKR